MYSLLRFTSRLPLAILYGLADVLYFVAYYVIRYRRRVVRDNLKACFPEKEEQAIQGIERCFYRHLADLIVEVIKAPSLSTTELRRRGVIIGHEEVNRYHQQGKPVLILMGHSGNWEWVNYMAAPSLLFPTDPVYKKLKNTAVDRFMYELRSKTGAKPIEKDKISREMVRRRNQSRNVVMLADQLPAQGSDRLWLEMLGRPTGFYKGPGQIAEFTAWPVFFVAVRKRSRGHYEAEYIPISDGSMSSVEVMQAYVKLLENEIRQQPENWLWSHRRWKYHPPSDFQLLRQGISDTQ